MKNITFVANELLIEKARKKAKEEMTSLNAKIQEWLRVYVNEQESPKNFEEYWAQYADLDVKGGSKLSREERNAR